MNRRIAAFIFSRVVLRTNDGFSKNLFSEILSRLPNDSKILAFGELPHIDVFTILIESNSFPEIDYTKETPTIDVLIMKNSDGSTYVGEVKYPKEIQDSHTCEFESVQLFTNSKEFCKICGKEK